MNPDFVDLLQSFIDAEVRFLIVGAYALAHHGRPRATGDLDVWVEATPANAPRVFRALTAFGAPMQEIRQEDFTQPGVVFQIGVPPGRIDVLTELTGVTFEQAWPERDQGHFGGLTVPYLLMGLLGARGVVRALTVGAFPTLFASTDGAVPPWLTGIVISGIVLAYIFYGGLRGAA